MMFQYTELSRDQFILGDQYVPDVTKYSTDIKMEHDSDSSYYGMGVNHTSLKFHNKDSTHCSPFMSLVDSSSSSTTSSLVNLTPSSFVGNPFQSSDGECSPKSLDENDLLDSMLGTSPCVKGIKTITRNPTRRNSKRRNEPTCGKIRNNRNRKSTESTLPKEKDRARLFNEAFDGLRKRIPSIPASKKLSKIEILRLAICYMSYLKFRLEDIPKLTSCHTRNEEELNQQLPLEVNSDGNDPTRSSINQSKISGDDIIVLTSD